MRKAYSPVRIRNAENATIRQSTITLEIENRYLFTNLKAVGITWKLGKRTGIATADIPAGKKTHAALSQTSIDFNSQAIPRPTKPPSGTRPQSLLRHPTFTPSNAATVNGKSIDTAGFWSRLPPSPRPDRSS